MMLAFSVIACDSETKNIESPVTVVAKVEPSILPVERPIDSLIEAIELNNRNNEAGSNYAIAQELNFNGDRFFQEGAIQEAIDQYLKALEYSPEYAQAWSNLGYSLIKTDKLPEAIWANKEALRFAKGENAHIIKASGYYNLAQIYELQQRWTKALEYFEQALAQREHQAYKDGINRMKNKLK